MRTIRVMDTGFSLTLPSHVVCGAGCATDASFGHRVAELGRKAVLLSGSSAKRVGLTDAMRVSLEAGGVSVLCADHDIPPEPTIEDCRRAMAQTGGADVVIGVGGGSALDVAKAAALAPA
ncbi:MAG: iron-containing alcohol dehydrogenase, partial [Armatimonadaceae bacterium]